MRILKFGGKSLASVEKTQNICKNIKKIYKNEKNIIIVVSAIGNTTDNLLKLASDYGGNYIKKRELANLLSTGEIVSASLFSIMLNSMNIPAKSLSAKDLEINTYGDYLNSRIYNINKQKILNCFDNNEVVVVAGFQGINKNKEVTTLGRGGSDTTAAALGATFDCDVEIYSDFDGVFCGDPRFLNYKKLKSASYNTLIKMAGGGAKVLDARAVTIAKNHCINIISKSSSLISNKGTLISSVEADTISISTIDQLSKITITFSNNANLQIILKNVILALKDVNFYNFEVDFDNISFCIDYSQKLKVVTFLSKKLKMLKLNQ